MGGKLGNPERPAPKAGRREGHDLRAPNVAEPTVRTGDDGVVHSPGGLDPSSLTEVAEREIGAVRTLLGQSAQRRRGWSTSHALEIGCRPRAGRSELHACSRL